MFYTYKHRIKIRKHLVNAYLSYCVETKSGTDGRTDPWVTLVKDNVFASVDGFSSFGIS
jgi:hypothetical protein